MDIGNVISKGIRGVAAAGAAFVAGTVGLAVYSVNSGTPITEIVPIVDASAKTADEHRAESNQRVVSKSVAAFQRATGIPVAVKHTGDLVVFGELMDTKFEAWSSYESGWSGYQVLHEDAVRTCSITTGNAKTSVDEIFHGEDGGIRRALGTPTAAMMDYMLVWHELAHCHDMADKGRVQATEIDAEMVADVYMAAMLLKSKNVSAPEREIERFMLVRSINGYYGKTSKDGVKRIDAGHFTSPALAILLDDLRNGRLNPQVGGLDDVLAYARDVSRRAMQATGVSDTKSEVIQWAGESYRTSQPYASQSVSYQAVAYSYGQWAYGVIQAAR